MLSLDKGYVLQCKPYRETSAILRLMTNTQGVLSGVIKGVYSKTNNSAALRPCLQVGNLVEFQWQGKSSLKNIYHVELSQLTTFKTSEKFICLCYVNELVLHFLQEQHSSIDTVQDNIFQDYAYFINNFTNTDVIEPLLRNFEFSLLRFMGYALDFGFDIDTQAPINTDLFYRVIPNEGVRFDGSSTVISCHHSSFLGRDLLLLQEQEYSNPLLRVPAKKISRLLLDFYLEGKPIKSRQLYKEMFPK